LGRKPSVRSPATTPKRTSSLAAAVVLSTENQIPVADEALLLELVNAKTAEAVAKQEFEEMRAKYESMRKMLGQGTPSPSNHRVSPSECLVSVTDYGMSPQTTIKKEEVKASAAGGGSFWGWGKKAASSVQR